VSTLWRWLACNLQSGKLIEELPNLIPSSPLSSILATYTSCSFALPIATAPRDWEAAIQEGQAMIVAMLDNRPIWAGAVLTCETGSSETADLGCVSLEGYLDHRYVGDHTWTEQDEASVIAAGLAADANVEGIGLTVDAPATGTLRDRTYGDQDDKTVYSALRELMGVIDGPEWTIGLSWDDATQTVTKTLRVRKRIGAAAAIPSAVFDSKPSSVFDSRGASSTEYRLLRDWSSGKGANHVVAVSSGQGDARPQSEPARDIRSGWARWEHRWTPSTSITSIDTLNEHAQRTLELMSYGARTLAVKARADVDPMLGRDWEIGDDIGYDLIGPAHPAGLKGTARAIGWKLDPVVGIVEPILLLPGGSIGGI
jgi:hypothetical protein